MLSDLNKNDNQPQSPLYPPTELFPTVPDCPFCTISTASPPARDPPIVDGPKDKAYIVLSTPSVIAFLDIAPVSRGHVLIAPRAHDETIADVKAEEAAVLGFWLPILSRGVMRGVGGGKGDGREGRESWNLVQANGHEAGQTVPHTHFHVIPRAATAEGRDATDTLNGKTRGFEVAMERKLDPRDATELQQSIKERIGEEVDKLRSSGEITDGRFLWEYWGNVEGRRGLRL